MPIAALRLPWHFDQCVLDVLLPAWMLPASCLTIWMQGIGGEVQSRLRQQGLALAPFGGNVATLACYAFSQVLARHLTDDPDFATLPLAALLLLLSQVPPSNLQDQLGFSSLRAMGVGRLELPCKYRCCSIFQWTACLPLSPLQPMSYTS